MGTTADWSQLESNVAGTAPSSDLFGGELFGEELIDIYNSETMVANAGDVSSEIPSLPVPEHTASASSNVPVAPPSGTDSVDDGLGAFRPSTSFNDLASLLEPNGAPAATPSGVEAPNIQAMATTSANPPAPVSVPKKESKKRAANATKTEGPTVKKVRAVPQKVVAQPVTATARRAVVVTKARKPVVVPTGHGIKVGPQSVKAPKVVQARGGKANTPNPLGVNAAPTVTRKAASGVVKPTVVTSGPAVVTPRVVAPVMTTKSEAAPKAPVLAAPTGAVRREGLTTEADFKSVAQAAVTNLILNASSQKSDKKDSSNNKVDTSAAHIKALTSTNWVAACAGPNGSPAVNAAAQAAAEAKANRARRQNLTPDERARQNRDRNREHARNTRLRKKAYVEELKRTLTEMVAQREASEVEKRHSAQREVEQREVRFRVMEEFLKLRGRNESNFARWSAILENGFSLTLPLTNYRKMAETSCSKKRLSGKRVIEQTLAGTSEVMSDSACFSSFLQTLGNEAVVGSNGGAVTTFLYHCDRKNFFMDSCNSVLSFTANSVGAVGKGAPYELTLKGLMRAKFCPASNKLMSAEFSFDTGMIAEQLRELIISRVVPAPMDTCDAGVAETAAHVAVTEADALLESLQMPQLEVGSVPTNITVHPSENLAAQVSVNGSDKESISSDESCEDMAGKGSVPEPSVATRRSSRLKD